jgi:hypothetical protein
MSAVPTSANVRDSHDGQANASQPASVNKVYAIQPKNGTTSTPFNGSQYQIEFEFPNYLGKVIEAVIQMDMTFTTTSATSANLVVLPTTLWFDRCEVLYGNNVIETLDADQLHIETVVFDTDQEFRNLEIPVNVGSDGGFKVLTVGGATAAEKTLTQTFYLPLWASWFNTLQPFVKGFRDLFRLRFYSATDIVNASLTTATGITNTMPKIQLWATEAQLSDSATRKLEIHHKKGMVYRSILRNKWQKIDNLTDAAEYNQVVQTFTADSAAVALYARPNSTLPQDLLTRTPFAYVALLDSTGSELTQRIPDGLLKYFIIPETVPFTSLITDQAKDSYYVFPLCSNLLAVLEDGQVRGGLKFSGNERIVIKVPPGGSASNQIITALSWDYCVVNVSQGSASVERHG